MNTLQWPKFIALKMIPQALEYKIKIYNQLLEKYPDLEIECNSFEDFLSHKETLYADVAKVKFTSITIDQEFNIAKLYSCGLDIPLESERLLVSTKISLYFTEHGFHIYAKPKQIELLNYESWQEALLDAKFSQAQN